MKKEFLDHLEKALQANSLPDLKKQIETIKHDLLPNFREENSESSRKMVVLAQELEQILEAYSLERAKYYCKRMEKSFTVRKTPPFSDINLNRWKDYQDIITESLWVIERRDSSGVHAGWYWGNFIPQIPFQLMRRYTKRGELVLDPFVGSGTTMIECRRLGRHGLGVELNPKTAEKARDLVAKERNPHAVQTQIMTGDSRNYDLPTATSKMGFKAAHLLILHPPYQDIIRFSELKEDLSNALTTPEFLEMFAQVLENTVPLLEKGRFLAVVIGDKYHQGQWIPLGFHCMQEVLKMGLELKSIVVKNFEETKGKRTQEALWRYRALDGGFYLFKHEYIFIFRKV